MIPSKFMRFISFSQSIIPFRLCTTATHRSFSRSMATKQPSCGSHVLALKGDVQIPVPWGHLAAKVWGPDDGVPMLALHGWLDNAGSFDRLAPLLPQSTRLVCLDTCGNGLSSPFPLGALPSHMDYISHAKQVFDYFKWEKCNILGHSMGGVTAIYFTSIYPELVEKLICIDTVSQTALPAHNLHGNMKNVLSQFHGISDKMAKGPSNKSVTYREAREKLMSNYGDSLDEKAADVLLVRGLTKVGEDQYQHTRDLRSIIVPFTSEEELETAIHSIHCPFLFIEAKDSILHKIDEFANFYNKVYAPLKMPGFQQVKVEGNHHVHLTHPERVAPQISEFLAKQVN